MAGEQAQYLHQNGAGYTINKKAWQDASVTGLKRKLLARLKLFGRPVDAAMLAERVAKELRIPIIGIGAGGNVDGQVLVVADMLGMTKGFTPKFLRRYADLSTVITDAVGHYIEDVKNCDFPNENEQY